eukprot:gene32419-biopygen13851
MNSLMLLVAKILGVKSEGADSDVFALMEGAMNVMGIHNLLPQSARRVDIAEVATELLSGDQILIRTAGSKQRFHHGIFVGPISGVQGGKNLVVDCWGSHDACKQEAKIRLRTLGEFMAVPGWPELADPSFKEESNASEEPMTTTVEDYDPLLRELENCRIKNQTLIKHNDELKLISETTMHENILLKSQLVPELSPYHFGHDLLTSLNLPFCNTKCCIVMLDSSGARQCKNNRQATGLLCTTHASSPKHVAEKVNKAYATRCFERHAKVISASQTQSDCVTAYTSACDDNKMTAKGCFSYKNATVNGFNITNQLQVRVEAIDINVAKIYTTDENGNPMPMPVNVSFRTGVDIMWLHNQKKQAFSASNGITAFSLSAAVKSTYDIAVSATNQTYGIGDLDSNGDLLLRGNLRISENANIYKGSIITCGQNNNGQLGNNTSSTGQHRCFVDALAPSRLRDHEGLVVVTDKNAYASGLLRGRQRAMTINQALPIVSLSKVPKDPRAFGVISLTQDHPPGPSASLSRTELLKIAEQGDVRVQINSIGEGCIWVCDETGSNIHAGDYVTTSSLSGYSSLQVLDDDGDVPDGTLRNYTVAKLTMDCDFSQPLVDVEEVQQDEYGNVVFDADGSLVYTIVTTTHGPSVVDPDTGEIRAGEPLETPIPVTEPSYEMRWMTTEIDASSGVSITTIISKEDYEKRSQMDN